MHRPIHPRAVDVAAIEEHTLRLAKRAEDFDLSTPVTTCGEWTLADLAWHLLEVQAFWTFIIEQRPAGPDTHRAPERPVDDALADGLRRVNAGLSVALDGAGDDEPAWSWSDDHTVGFTRRRQSHEALIHAIDADLATGAGVPPIDPALAADGVDEMLGIMLDAPDGSPVGADGPLGGRLVTLIATDTGDTWHRRFGTVTIEGRGRLPALESVDRGVGPGIRDGIGTGVGDDATVISGAAIDLDRWLWGRGEQSALSVEGDDALAAALRTMVVAASQ